MRTVQSVIDRLPSPDLPPLPAPPYLGSERGPSCRVGLAVESMKYHMTDEGWQVFQGLEHAGWQLRCRPFTHVPTIIDGLCPDVVLLQDKREWEGRTAGPGFDPQERFSGVEELRREPGIFKLTILKDAQGDPPYHRRSAEEIGCHAWVVYYHPRIVKHLAPYVREEHLVRTYHSVDSSLVPPFDADRKGVCLLSGALSGAYPLRTRLWRELDCDKLPHPGYGRAKCYTPDMLQKFAKYKVAICTSSIYGYVLRKIVEATACGCRVITDLPSDEEVPGIDGNLVRIDSDASTKDVAVLVRMLAAEWDPDQQAHWAARAVANYAYQVVGARLSDDIERMRRAYKQE